MGVGNSYEWYGEETVYDRLDGTYVSIRVEIRGSGLVWTISAFDIYPSGCRGGKTFLVSGWGHMWAYEGMYDFGIYMSCFCTYHVSWTISLQKIKANGTGHNVDAVEGWFGRGPTTHMKLKEPRTSDNAVDARDSQIGRD